MSENDGLLGEIRRRKVGRVILVYVAAAFAVLEFADIAFPRLGLPDAAINVVLVFGILGLPIAVALAWVFEVKTENPEKNLSSPLVTIPTVVVALILVMAGVIVGQLWDTNTKSASSVGIPRIAVLPFENRSNNPQDDYFSDGLAEDIATALSRFPGLSVIPPGIATQYPQNDDGELAGVLRARYFVRGSVQRNQTEVRVIASLVDPIEGTQLWAESYSRELGAADLFDLQAEVANRIATTLADATGVVVKIGLQDVRRRPTHSLEAYDCVLRGQAYVANHDDKTHADARECLERAVKIDPHYADAWAHLAYLYQEEYHHNRNALPGSLDRALEAAARAVELDAGNTKGLMALAMTHFSRGDLDLAQSQMERALSSNPTDTMILSGFAVNSVFAGDIERGLELVDRARALNPTPPNWIYNALGAAHYLRGEYQQALVELGNWGPTQDTQIEIFKAASLGMLGRREEAEEVLDNLLATDPAFASDPSSELRRYFLAPATISAVTQGLVRAGLREKSLELVEEPDEY